MPVASKITRFRGPLMRAYRGHDALVEGVRETLAHEVARHLGISDAHLQELKTRRGSGDGSSDSSGDGRAQELELRRVGRCLT